MTPPFILASGSPRRRDLLASVGLEPAVHPQHVDESPRPGETPVRYGLRVARDKALAAVASGLSAPILAADTVVALDGEILAKASSEDEAVVFLQRLSGRTHTVHTAVVVVSAKSPDIQHSRVVSTRVRFRTLSDDEIRRYVSSGEPMDKAGAYGIQGLGGALVAAVDGSYTNVVGLPLEESLTLLSMAGSIQP